MENKNLFLNISYNNGFNTLKIERIDNSDLYSLTVDEYGKLCRSFQGSYKRVKFLTMLTLKTWL